MDISTSNHAVLQYPVIVHQEDDGYWVECPSFSGCYSQGDTIEETFKNIKEAMDIIGYTPEEFEKMDTVDSPMIKQIKKEGYFIYPS